MSTAFSKAQVAADFSIELPAKGSGIAVPVVIKLEDLGLSPSGKYHLLQSMNGKKIRIPIQVDAGTGTVSWIVPGDAGDLKYQLIAGASRSAGGVRAVDSDGAITFKSGKKNLASYVHKLVYPPAGIDSHYKRSAFIHPVWTPHGQVLTRIQPPDHYHHYGIWNPWTHTLFENDTVDFWNIRGRQGTVRFAKFNSITDGPVYSELEALHEHVVFKKDGTEKVALNELQKIRIYAPQKGEAYYIMDITSRLSCASQSPLLILAYRYAGLGWRATEYWHKDNSEMLTSEGKMRDYTDGSKAKWCMVYGQLPGNDEGGILMFSHPANYNHPEPLRIWDKKANGGRGDVFANFAPTKDKDWLIEPGKTYELKYRLIVFNGKIDAEKAEKAWKQFASDVKLK